MAGAILNMLRLAKAGLVLAQHGVRFVPPGMKVPPALIALRAATAPIRWLSAPFRIGQPKSQRVAGAIAALGPSYIKLGQFLATRADVIGPDLARELSSLQDRLPPFSMAEARAAVEASLGGKLEDHFVEFGPPVAAASIAQVHKAVVKTRDGTTRTVAVKILRPSVEKRFKRDLDSYYFAARLVERLHAPSRRLKPVAIVDTLKRTTELEMDLRLEAAAISEMADNTRDDPAFRVPEVDWTRTAKRVLTLEWIDGTPIANHAALDERRFDKRALGLTVIRSFLRHAMKDGFFHADMHQGNLFVDEQGRVVAVDFGIMGRLGPRERRFLAEILHGLITRDYKRAAWVHFWAGYVPPHHPVDVFAQALRAIGEPIHGRVASEISMADLLGQLFEYTEVFDMQTRPELIMLQKSMVIVEGVARSLDPALNMWTAAEPIAKEWMQANLGVLGRIKEAGEGATTIGHLIGELPGLLSEAQAAFAPVTEMAQNGVRLSPESITALGATRQRGRVWGSLALWLAALSLAALAARQLGLI
ncbi:MAG: 2-polyprenylphenol 6-hydroxylase [Hyphomicrobiaceae bacterium]|nr:2-polyprenylphenol 6-hydroxylase [Hyphomicrobiaceae bacterium]